MNIFVFLNNLYGIHIINMKSLRSFFLLLNKLVTLEMANIPLRSILHIERWKSNYVWVWVIAEQIYCGWKSTASVAAEVAGAEGCVCTQPDRILTLDLCSATRWTIFNGLYLANLESRSQISSIEEKQLAKKNHYITFCSCDWFQPQWHSCKYQQE